MTPELDLAPSLPYQESDRQTHIINPHSEATLLLRKAYDSLAETPELSHGFCETIIADSPGCAEAAYAFSLQGWIKLEAGEPHLAKERFSRALETAMLIADREPFAAADILMIHSSSLNSEGHFFEAQNSSVRALSIVERNLGHTNYSGPQHLECFAALNDILRETESWDILKSTAERTLAKLERAAPATLEGKGHEFVISATRFALTHVAWLCGDFETARVHALENVAVLGQITKQDKAELHGNALLQFAALNFVTLRPGEANECLDSVLKSLGPQDLIGSLEKMFEDHKVEPSDKVLITSGVRDWLFQKVRETSIDGRPIAELDDANRELSIAFVESWILVGQTHSSAQDLESAKREFSSVSSYLTSVGPETHKLVYVLALLGHACFESGAIEEARQAYTASLAQNEKIDGPDTETTGLRCFDLAVTMSRLGEHSAALPYLERALIIAEGFSESIGLKLARIHQALGSTYLALNQFEKAYSNGKTAIEMAESVEEIDASDLITYLLDHADNTFRYAKEGDNQVLFEEAWRTKNRAEDIVDQLDLPEHFDLHYRYLTVELRLARSIPHYSSAVSETLQNIKDLLGSMADRGSLDLAKKYIALGLNACDADFIPLAKRAFREGLEILKDKTVNAEIVPDLINLVMGSSRTLIREVELESDGGEAARFRENIDRGAVASMVTGDGEELEKRFDVIFEASKRGGVHRERGLQLAALFDVADKVMLSLHNPKTIGPQLSGMLGRLRLACQATQHHNLSRRVGELQTRIAGSE